MMMVLIWKYRYYQRWKKRGRTLEHWVTWGCRSRVLVSHIHHLSQLTVAERSRNIWFISEEGCLDSHRTAAINALHYQILHDRTSRHSNWWQINTENSVSVEYIFLINKERITFEAAFFDSNTYICMNDSHDWFQKLISILLDLPGSSWHK